MRPVFAEEKAPVKPTPERTKKILLFFLFGTAAIGFISGAVLLTKSVPVRKAPSKPESSQTSPKRSFKSNAESDFSFRKTPARTIICQGTVIPRNGRSMTIINGKALSVGATTNGVKILEITENFVLIENNGKTRKLKIGDKFTPAEK